MIQTCKHLSSELIADCVQSNVEGGQTATLKIKFASFDVITRSLTVNYIIKQSEILFSIAKTLLVKEFKSRINPSVIFLTFIQYYAIK